MTRKLIVSVISIFLLVLAIVSASIAWFVSSAQVSAVRTTLTADTSLNMEISVLPTTDYEPYMGQTGLNSTTDSPYTVDFVMSINYNAIGFDNMALKVFFNSVDITKISEESPMGTLDEDGSNAAFSWRIYNFTVVDGHYVKGTGYMPDDRNFAVQIADNSVPLALVGKGSVSFLFTLVFQSEENYRKWINADYDFDAFPYSSVDYMDAVFAFSVNFSMANFVAE